jgi:hypothetical protein
VPDSHQPRRSFARAISSVVGSALEQADCLEVTDEVPIDGRERRRQLTEAIRRDGLRLSPRRRDDGDRRAVPRDLDLFSFRDASKSSENERAASVAVIFHMRVKRLRQCPEAEKCM